MKKWILGFSVVILIGVAMTCVPWLHHHYLLWRNPMKFETGVTDGQTYISLTAGQGSYEFWGVVPASFRGEQLGTRIPENTKMYKVEGQDGLWWVIERDGDVNTLWKEISVADIPPDLAQYKYASTLPSYKTLESLPGVYPLEQAVADGCYIDMHGKIWNEQQLSNFLSARESQANTFIRTIRYTIEGDMIITDATYNAADGKFYVWIDSTRDKFGSMGIETFVFDDLQTEINENGSIMYFFSNPDNIETRILLANISHQD